MARLEAAVFIAVPPEAVWDELARLERHGCWMVDMRSLRIVGEQTRGVGVLMEATSAIFGLTIVRDTIEVTGWEPPRRLVIVHRTASAPPGTFALRGWGSFTLETSDQGTTVRWVEEVTPPLGALGELAFSLVVRRHMLRTFGRSLAALRRIVETSVRP